MIADRIPTGEVPLPIRTWTSQQQMVTDSTFKITMTRGGSRLATLVVTYAKEEDGDEKEANVLYFPDLHSEQVEVLLTDDYGNGRNSLWGRNRQRSRR